MVKLNKIYTRTGDDGTTGLVDGSRRAKHDVRMQAIGDVDEANSALGFAALAIEGTILADLRRVQNDLFDLGADLATPGEVFAPSETDLRIVPAQVEWLECAIDKANAPLPALRSFILPGGTPGAALLHVARTVARRAERAVWALLEEDPERTSKECALYLNRLSDLLFILARHANPDGDVLWQPGGER